MSKKAGRPSKLLDRKYLPVARQLALLGAKNADLAQAFEVEERTIERWIARDSEFCRVLKSAKAAADARVERSLFDRATGYRCEDTHFSAYEGKVTATPYTRQYPPDPVSCIFWLKNRRPDLWRDRIEAKMEVSTVAGVPAEVLENLRKLARQAADEPNKKNA
jgi:hypothetical protein